MAHMKLRLPYKCPYCEFRVKRKRELADHLVARHLDRKPFKCDICQRKFRENEDKEMHQRKAECRPADVKPMVGNIGHLTKVPEQDILNQISRLLLRKSREQDLEANGREEEELASLKDMKTELARHDAEERIEQNLAMEAEEILPEEINESESYGSMTSSPVQAVCMAEAADVVGVDGKLTVKMEAVGVISPQQGFEKMENYQKINCFPSSSRLVNNRFACPHSGCDQTFTRPFSARKHYDRVHMTNTNKVSATEVMNPFMTQNNVVVYTVGNVGGTNVIMDPEMENGEEGFAASI